MRDTSTALDFEALKAKQRAIRDGFSSSFGLRLHAWVWDRFSGPIRLLLESRYVFGPFWSHQNGQPGYENWEDRFAAARRVFHAALARRDTPAVLSMLFDRLNMLRNQLVHGGDTWDSSFNRDQLRDCAQILQCLVPIMADIMMDNADENWSRPFYPVLKEGSR